MGSSPGGGFPCLARFGPQHFLAFLARTAPVSLCSMVSPARGIWYCCAGLGLLLYCHVLKSLHLDVVLTSFHKQLSRSSRPDTAWVPPCWMFQRADPEGKERETCWWPWRSRHKEILVCSDFGQKEMYEGSYGDHPKMKNNESDVLKGYRFFGGGISVYSVSCMSNVIFNPSLLNWSSLILTVAHMFPCVWGLGK